MIYILLPIYNEERRLPVLIEKLDKGMKRRGFVYHVIAYNDGSDDNSLEILNRFKKSMPITVMGQAGNKGLGVALESMLRKVLEVSLDNDDIAVVLDADDTHNPEHIYHMVNKVRDGFDMVIASRYLPDSRVVGVTMSRQIFSIGASWLMRTLFPIKGVRDYTCGYRAYTINCLRKAFEKFGDHLIEEKGFACMAELIIKLRSMDIIAVEVPIILRYDQKYGKSKMNIPKTIQRTLLMLYRLGKI
jgi:dolichol-phosphate mannosyltransferase